MRLNNALTFYSGKRSRGWPPERRMKQSARIRAAKIWRKSTGPRTPQGKAQSSMNAITHGYFTAGWQALRKAFTLYRRFLKWAQMVIKHPEILSNRRSGVCQTPGLKHNNHSNDGPNHGAFIFAGG